MIEMLILFLIGVLIGMLGYAYGYTRGSNSMGEYIAVKLSSYIVEHPTDKEEVEALVTGLINSLEKNYE